MEETFKRVTQRHGGTPGCEVSKINYILRVPHIKPSLGEPVGSRDVSSCETVGAWAQESVAQPRA